MKYFDINEVPKRDKESSDGEKAKSHGATCNGGVFISYDENRWYSVHCENCGIIAKFKTNSYDEAIKIWNDMPDVVGMLRGRRSK